MTIVKFNSLSNFNPLEEKVHSFNGEIPSNLDASKLFFPKIDISEDEKNIYFEVEIPGANKDEINIKLENNILTIKGDKRLNEDKSKKTLISSERIFGSFIRSFTLHEEANPDETSAEFENGVLKISIGKALNKSIKERRIQIK